MDRKVMDAMDAGAEVETLGDALPKQMERVQKLVGIYRSLPAGVGLFAVWGMERDLAKARQAIAEGDVVGQLRIFQELKTWKK